MIGDFTPGKTVRLRFNTHKADGTPVTLAGTPAISVYKGSTTESTAGVTLTVDYDSRTGLHDVVIDTSADGTFYAAGNDFHVVITAGTVDSISVVGTVVGAFSLSNRSALRPTTADRTLDVSAGGEAGLDWANIGSPTTTVGLSGTTVGTVTANSDKTGYSLSGAQTFNLTGNITGNLSGSVGSVTGAVGSVTGSVGSVTGAVGSVTGNVGGNVTGSVGSIAAGGIVTASFAAGATVPRVTLVDTLTTYTNNTPQSGDAFARLGLNGAGLTALGDTRLAALARLVAMFDGGTPDKYTAAALSNAPAGGGGGGGSTINDQETIIEESETVTVS